MNEANQLNQQSDLHDQEFAKASVAMQSGLPGSCILQPHTITPLPGDYDVSTKVRIGVPAQPNAERPSPRSTPEIRQQALEAALRCSHPGSVTAEVIRVALEFEAYLTGSDTTAPLP